MSETMTVAMADLSMGRGYAPSRARRHVLLARWLIRRPMPTGWWRLRIPDTMRHHEHRVLRAEGLGRAAVDRVCDAPGQRSTLPRRRRAHRGVRGAAQHRRGPRRQK